MTATMEAERTVTRFDAENIARGWLSVALAASADDARPALTGVHVEFYATGVRLIATDSYMLLRAWVPCGDAPEPALDEAPDSEATALDPYGRGVGLMRHLLKIATAKDAPPYDCCLSVGDDPREEPEPSLVGLERQYLILDVPDQEILTLPLFEGSWPTWRSLWSTFVAETTSEINFSPELIVARLGRLGKLHPEGILRWQFGGASRAALVELSPSSPRVMGLVMPTKVYLPGFDPEISKPIGEAIVEAVNAGVMGEGWSAEMTEGGAVVNVDLDVSDGTPE